jgi:hypothetical protein
MVEIFHSTMETKVINMFTENHHWSYSQLVRSKKDLNGSDTQNHWVRGLCQLSRTQNN